MDASTDAGTDSRWMSYAELAELRGIDDVSPEAGAPAQVATPEGPGDGT